ncbi:Flp family type IVb pilin [Frateuria aurantia]
MNALKRFLADEEGATAIEYGILAALVATALAVAFYPALKNLYTELFTQMTTTVNSAAQTGG